MVGGKTGQWLLQRLSRVAAVARGALLGDERESVTSADRTKSSSEAVLLEEQSTRMRLTGALRLHRRASEQGSFLSQRKIGDCAAGIPPFVLQQAALKSTSVASVEADAQDVVLDLDVAAAPVRPGTAATAAGAVGAASSAISTTNSVFAGFPPPLCRRNRSLASVWYNRAANLVRSARGFCCLIDMLTHCLFHRLPPGRCRGAA